MGNTDDNTHCKTGTYSRDYFARYRYTAYRAERLIQRGHALKPSLFNKTLFGNVTIIHICDGRGRECKLFRTIAFEPFQSLNSETKCKDVLTVEPTVTIVHSHCFRRNVQRNVSDLVLLTNDDEKTIDAFKEEHKQSILIVTQMQDIKQNTNLLLERFVCGILGKMVDRVVHDPSESNGLDRQTIRKSASFKSVRVLRQTAATIVPYTCARTGSDEKKLLRTKDLNVDKLNGSTSGTLRSGKMFRSSRTPEAAEVMLEILLLDVMALYKRSDVPTSEWPHLTYPKQRDLISKLVSKLFEMDSSVFGCGYQHHILKIYLNREANASLDSVLIATLNKRNHFHYHFNYGPIKYTPLCGIMVGSHIGTQQKTATLGGFAMANEKLYAIVPGHLVQMVGKFIKHRRQNGDFVCIAAHTCQLQGDFDIAAAHILPGTPIVDTRFRDSAGNFTSSMLFNFEGQTEQQIRDALQNESIFAWTAQSVAQPSRGEIKIPIFRRPDSQLSYVVIENETDENGDNGAAGPPVAQSFGREGDSGSIICFDDMDGNGVHVVSMLMGKQRSHDVVGFMTMPLQQGLQHVSTSLQENLQLC